MDYDQTLKKLKNKNLKPLRNGETYQFDKDTAWAAISEEKQKGVELWHQTSSLPDPGDPNGIGLKVVIHSLNSAAHYNETGGTIEGSSGDRWEIRMDYDGSLKKLKNKNLRIAQG